MHQMLRNVADYYYVLPNVRSRGACMISQVCIQKGVLGSVWNTKTQNKISDTSRLLKPAARDHQTIR